MKSFVLISRVRPPKLEDGSSSVGNCPGDVANGPDDSARVFLYPCRDHTNTHIHTHVCAFNVYAALATSSSFSPRNPVGLILKILFDVDKSGHIGVKVFARVSYLSRRNDAYSFSLQYRECVLFCKCSANAFFILSLFTFIIIFFRKIVLWLS